MEPFDPMHMSYSALNLLQQCGEAFFRRYIERERTPSTLRMLRGQAVHKVAATIGQAQADQIREFGAKAGSPTERQQARTAGEFAIPPAADVQDMAATSFDAELRGGVTLTPEEVSRGVGKVLGESKDFAVRLSTLHADYLAPTWVPELVEHGMRVQVDIDDVPVEIVSFLDVVEIDGVVRDLKTGVKRPAEDAAHKSQQLTLYALGRRAEIDEMPSGLALDYLVDGNTKREPEVVTLTTTRTEEQLQAMVERLATAVRAIRAGVFVPANPGVWWCSPTYCEFYETCKYVR